MSEISDGNIKMVPGIRKQASILHQIQEDSLEQFTELMKVMDFMSKDAKIKDELRNVKGPKKKLTWKKE